VAQVEANSLESVEINDLKSKDGVGKTRYAWNI
jgi:hypothetical protein